MSIFQKGGLHVHKSEDYINHTQNKKEREITLLIIIDISSKPKQMAYRGKYSPASFFSKIFCKKQKRIGIKLVKISYSMKFNRQQYSIYLLNAIEKCRKASLSDNTIKDNYHISTIYNNHTEYYVHTKNSQNVHFFWGKKLTNVLMKKI